ncbi:hypothetical protein [Paenibacillus sp. PL2-23]|uniref:hypothetical protein n=1 Tax=Paenibacillus sp. PL2-23 TaxID=2100729 RepID=UPI0030F63735
MSETTNIHHALAIIADAAGTSGWALGGSAALLLRGIPLEAPPRDIDLYCDQARLDSLHLALAPYATDSPAYSETPIYRSTLSHYVIGACKVELVTDFQVDAHGCRYRVDVAGFLVPFGDEAELELSETRHSGSPRVRVAPLAHELLFNVLRGRADRISTIAEAMGREAERQERLLAELEARNEITSEISAQMRCLLGGERAWTQR